MAKVNFSLYFKNPKVAYHQRVCKYKQHINKLMEKIIGFFQWNKCDES